jgi:hypothetical protein
MHINNPLLPPSLSKTNLQQDCYERIRPIEYEKAKKKG